jgi:hypothetical protein
MKTLRELYIETGAIVPFKPKPVLRMTPNDRLLASWDMEEYYEHPEQCEVPLEQVPDYVLEYWRDHGKI